MKCLHLFIYVLLASIDGHTQSYPLYEGLVAYYPFNGTAEDQSGYGNHGSVSGAILCSDRHSFPNAAYWFDGTSAFIEIPDNPSLDLSSELTIAGWMKKDSDIPWASMVTKGDYSPGLTMNNNYTLHNSTGNGVVFTSSEIYNVCQSSAVIPINEWHFIAVTCSSSLNAKIYIDGYPDSSSFMNVGGALTPNDFSLFIGVDHPGVTEYFSGCLDDIMIFNRELSSTEIQELYGVITLTNQGSPSSQLLLVYPNPAENFSMVRFNNPEEEPYELYLRSSNGLVFYHIKRITADNFIIPTAELPAGMYFLELAGKTLMTKKLLVR